MSEELKQEHVHDENCNHEPEVSAEPPPQSMKEQTTVNTQEGSIKVQGESSPTSLNEEERELIKKHCNEAVQALVPLLDNDKTRHVGHVLLKALDFGLGLLGGGTNPDASNQLANQPQPGTGTVPQAFTRDIEQENQVQDLVNDTLKELEMMDNHESSPVTKDKDGNEIEYVKGMLCNCQFASEFHKYCDNQCKETLIKAEGNPKEYAKFLEKERDVQDTKGLDEAMDDVTDFIDTELGIGVSPKPSVIQKLKSETKQSTPGTAGTGVLDPEAQGYALDPDQPVVMPGQPSGIEEDSNCSDEKADDTFVPTKAAREGDVDPL
jgi:hypothetical protein